MDIQLKIEKIFDCINQVSPIRFAVQAYYQGEISEDSIRSNAKVLIERDVRLYKASNSSTKDFFHIHQSEELFKDVSNSINSSTIPIEFFYKDKAICLVFNHSIADARTAIVFLQKLFGNQLNELSTFETNNLLPLNSFPADFKGSPGAFKVFIGYLRHAITEFIEGFTKHPGEFNQKGNYTDIVLKELSLSERATKALLIKCQQDNISITVLLAAIQLQATRKVLFNNRDLALGVCLAADLRKKPVELIHYNVLAVFISFISLVVKFKGPMSTVSVADILDRNLKNKIAKGKHYTLINMFPPLSVLSKSLVAIYQKLNEKCSLLSNVGAIESFSNQTDNNLLDINFWVPPNAEQPFSCCACTSDGKLHINMVSFPDRFSKKSLDSVFDAIKYELNQITQQ